MFSKVRWTERGAIAFALVLLFGLVIYLGFNKTANWKEAKEFVNIILPALTSFIGAALGYYFGRGSVMADETRSARRDVPPDDGH